MSIDRRVARTRAALYDALVALILRQGYDAIRVQDLLEEANIGRATFYAHFSSKEELLARSMERVRAILLEAVSDANDPGGWRLALLVHIAEFRPVYLALNGVAAGDVLRDAIRKVVTGFVAERLRPLPDLSVELQAEHVAGTFMTLVRWWLERKPSLKPQAVDQLFGRLLAGEARPA
jgi:AcrR family transcriptional regulator